MSSMLEKLNQMREEEKEKERQEPQMAVGQQLEIMAKMKEIEYQNSLVMVSLEKYNEKFKELKKEQTELLELIAQKTKKLEDNNQIFEEIVSEEVLILNGVIKDFLKDLQEKTNEMNGNLIDKGARILGDIEQKIDSSYKNNISDLTSKTQKTMEEYTRLQKKATERYESYYNRKKIIDYLVYANLAITPILLFILSWILLK